MRTKIGSTPVELYSLATMKLEDLFKLADMDGVFDFARPMEWDRQARAIGINPDGYVWYYAKDGGSMGSPVHIGDVLRKVFADLYHVKARMDRINEED